MVGSRTSGGDPVSLELGNVRNLLGMAVNRPVVVKYVVKVLSIKKTGLLARTAPACHTV